MLCLAFRLLDLGSGFVLKMGFGPGLGNTRGKITWGPDKNRPKMAKNGLFFLQCGTVVEPIGACTPVSQVSSNSIKVRAS